MKKRESGRTTLKLVLFQIIVGVLLVSYIIPGSRSNSASEDLDAGECWICGVRGVPFPDEDINCYVGKVIDPEVIAKITQFVLDKYPGHCTSFTFKIIDTETEWIDLDDDTQELRLQKMLLLSYLDHGVISPEGKVLEPPIAEKVKPLAGPYFASGTLPPLSGRTHNLHYLDGLYEFESHTSWTPSYADMAIGLWNYITEKGRTRTYTSSPADDIRHNWDFPYYYGFFIVNLESCTTVSYSGYYYYLAD